MPACASILRVAQNAARITRSVMKRYHLHASDLRSKSQPERAIARDLSTEGAETCTQSGNSERAIARDLRAREACA